MGGSGAGEGFTSEQRRGLETRQVDQDRTLLAMQQLEAALSEAAPRREAEWRATVLAALSILEAAMVDESLNAERPDSLLADLSRTQPWLRNRARDLRLQYRRLYESIRALRAEIEANSEAGGDFADVRHRLDWLFSALRHQRARESDLIYEAYYDAFKVDLRRQASPDDSATE